MGVDGQVFEDIKAAIVEDRYAFFKSFLDNFYNVDVLGPDRISDQAWQASFNVAGGSFTPCNLRVRGHVADRLSVRTCRRSNVPTLVVHGTEDRILPFEAYRRTAPWAYRGPWTVVPVEGGPHNIG